MLHLRWLLAGLLAFPAAAHAQQTQPAPATRPAARPAEKPPAPASSEDEQLSRLLLTLKDQRVQAAAAYGNADGRVRELDRSMDDLRQQIAARSGAFGPPAATAASQDPDAQANALAALFPRIAPTPDLELLSATWPGGVPIVDIDTSADRDAREKLENTLVNFTIDRAPLGAVLASLGEQIRVSLDVNWTALKEVGVEWDTPVSIHVTGVAADRVLKLALSQASTPTTALGYTICGGVVTISAMDDLVSSKYQIVKVFDVRDLAAIDWGVYPVDLAMQLRDMKFGDLMDTIKSIVAPDTWRDSGGTVGSIRELNGQLIVNQTVDNQRAIAVLLARLRQR